MTRTVDPQATAETLKAVAVEIRAGNLRDPYVIAVRLNRIAEQIAGWTVALTAPQPLTKQQAAILVFLRSFHQTHTYMPSLQEIADDFGYSSEATVHEHLVNLERKGAIRREFNLERSIIILTEPQPV
jgi:DNA-binding MarR family transcriptional regulator